jgi:RNA polymerase sigma factor (sigma-70 family)
MLAVRERDDQISDRDLLRRFVACRDEDAFAALFRRHGAMVLGVATRVLHHHADAEDVRQATFLLLARKAGAVPWRDSVANWLYGVAYRLALQCRHSTQRRNARNARADVKPEPDPLADITLRDLEAVLDEELQHLPRKYRAVLMLCCLEGMARDEAARCLGVPLATVKSRLEAGRDMLRSRLARRGLALPAVLGAVSLPSAVAGAALPMGLSRVTSKAAVLVLTGKSAAGLISADVLALVRQASGAMPLTKVRLALASLLVGCLTLFAFGAQQPAATEPAPRQQTDTAQAPRLEGDPQVPSRGRLEPERGEEAMAVTYSSTGEWLATAEMNGTVRLWNARTKRPGPVLRGPERTVRSLVFTPDGATVIAACDDGKIYIWDVPGGKLKTTLQGHRGQVCAVALTSDGKTLASCAGIFDAGTMAHRELKIWDLAQAKCIRDIECTDDICTGSPTSLVFAPGTDLLAAGTIAPFRGIKVWNATSGKEVKRFTYREGFPLALAISPDGKWLAAGGGDAIPASPTASRLVGTLHIWDWQTGKPARTLAKKTEGYFRAVAFSRDGTRLIAACPGPTVARNALSCTSNIVSCWDPRNWTRLWSAQGVFGDVWALDVAPDGQSATVSDSSGTSLLDMCLGRTEGQWLATNHRVFTEDFGPSRVLNRPAWPGGLVDAINGDSRVYARWRNGTDAFFYRGQPAAVNAALRKYAAIKSNPRHLLVVPGPGRVETQGGKPMDFDWQIQIPGTHDQPTFGSRTPVMTVCISALKPRAADRAKINQWLKDLDSDVFGTRETSYDELRKLGSDAKPALRAAMQTQPTLESRRRIESLLARLPGIDVSDLEIPDGITVIDASDLIAKGLRDLNHPERNVRIAAIQELSAVAHLSDRIVPALATVLEADTDAHLRQVAAACLGDVGVTAKPAAPALKRGLADGDVNVRRTCQQALARLADPGIQREHIGRQQAIAEEIRAWKITRTVMRL